MTHVQKEQSEAERKPVTEALCSQKLLFVLQP